MKSVIKICSLISLIILLPMCTTPQKQKEAKDNEVIQTILSRKSVRDYTSQSVSRDTLELLARVAMSAPTAKNMQPWAFIIIDDKATLNQLAEKLPYAKMLPKAPAAIVVCGDLSKALPDESQALWIQDCSNASENLLIAVQALGLGAVWTSAYPDPERNAAVKTVLNLPDHIIPLNVIPIGYPAKNEPAKDKWKPENIRWNHW